MGGIFYNMKALFVMDDIEAKERYQRIVYAGGGDWMNDNLYGARKKRVDGRSLTHIIIDPWVLDKQEGRHRYYDFEDWLDYEKSVASKSSDTRDCQRWQNGGVVFKLHFTFLIDSLLKPNDNIKWKDYNIFDQRVQDLALKRRALRRKQKVKLERERLKLEQKNGSDEVDSDEDEEDLESVKQRFIQRSRARAPGRFYVEKNKGSAICEEEVRLEARAGVKRKAASDTAMVHHLGYMESTKRKNKRSAGSHIQADATRHIMQNGIVDTNKLFEDHGCAQLESLQADYIRNLNSNIQSVMNSHPLSNRPKTFTDDKWWNNRHQGRRDWGRQHSFFKGEVKDEYKREKQSGQMKLPYHQEEIVLDDSDSDIEIVEDISPSEERKKNAIGDDINEFNLPPGIVLVPKHPQDDDDDDIVFLPPEESEDVKPPLKDLVATLGGIPDVVQCYSDSEVEEEVVEEVFTTREESVDMDTIESPTVNPSPDPCPESGPEPSTPDVDLETMENISLENNTGKVQNDHPLLNKDEHLSGESSVFTEYGQIEDFIVTEASVIIKEPQDVTLESTVSDIQETPAITSSTTTSQSQSISLLQETDLLRDLNATILKRQENLKEHLVIGNVATQIPLHDRSGESGKYQAKLLPTPGQLCQEFSYHGDYQEPEVRKSRGRKKKTDSETSWVKEDARDKVQGLFSSLHYLSAFTSSQSLISSGILNVIWKHYFLENTCESLHLRAEDVLVNHFTYFPWSRGSNREKLLDIVLSSLRNVSDESMFRKFDKENLIDISTVVSFVEDIIEKSSGEEENKGAVRLLNIILIMSKIDFVQWWKQEKWTGKYPLIYYLLGGDSSFKRNMLRMVPRLYKVEKRSVRAQSREMLALTAMMAAFLDHHKEKEDYVHQGIKMELAEAIADILDVITDPDHIFYELSLLQPGWLSLLVSKCLLNTKQATKKTPRLCDISTMMKGMSLGNDRRTSYLTENLQYRLVVMSQSHLLLRANWFFTSNKEQRKFEVYSKMREIAKDTGRSKKPKDVILKSLVRVSLARQTQDLITITEIAQGDQAVSGGPGGAVRGDQAVRGEPGEAVRALMFVMTEEHDLGWHPGIQ